MKLKLICPITDKNFEKECQAEAEKYSSHGVTIDAERIPYGTASIESEYDEALSAPGIIKLGLDSANKGYDGIMVSCMGDPGVNALRELVDIPVVGPCRTALLYAADLSRRFSVITVTDGVAPIIERVALEVGVAGKMASCKAVNIPVLELVDMERLVSVLAKLALEAVEKYDAQCLVLGCTGMIGVEKKLEAFLMDKGFDVPVLYPVPVALKYLETLVSLGLSRARLSYPKPSDKERSIMTLLNG